MQIDREHRDDEIDAKLQEAKVTTIPDDVAKILKRRSKDLNINQFDSCYAGSGVYPPEMTAILIRVGLNRLLGGVTKIHQSMFSEEIPEPYADVNNDITLPNNIKEIESMGFGGCRNLESIQADGVESIGDHAFWACSNLKKATFKSVQEISNKVFADCVQLESVYFPDTIISIGERQFENCPKLKEVFISHANYEANKEQ